MTNISQKRRLGSQLVIQELSHELSANQLVPTGFPERTTQQTAMDHTSLTDAPKLLLLDPRWPSMLGHRLIHFKGDAELFQTASGTLMVGDRLNETTSSVVERRSI